jgi:hypothetical protein
VNFWAKIVCFDECVGDQLGWHPNVFELVYWCFQVEMFKMSLQYLVPGMDNMLFQRI